MLIALMADEARAEAMAVAGDAAGAAALADSLAALATERQDAAGLARARLLQAEAALTRGDVPEAHATAEAVLRDPAATPTARARALSLIARAARATGGDPDGRSEAAARSAAEGVWLGWWIQHRLSAA